MPRIRPLTPEAARELGVAVGEVAVVSPRVAQEWADGERAERIIDRDPPIERAGLTPRRY